MKPGIDNKLHIAMLLFAAILLSGCGGHKVLKDPQPLPDESFIAGSADDRVSVTVDWVIFRDGPGTWARDADWDEYVVTVTNNSAEPITVTGASVFDSMQVALDTEIDRKRLTRASKDTIDRYDDDGLTVEAGISGTELLVAGSAAGAAGVGLGAAAALGGAGVGVGAAAVAGVVAAPVLLGVGIAKGLNNGKVADEIEDRQAPLPLQMGAGESRQLHFFFPLAPSPQQVVIAYTRDAMDYSIAIDTTEALAGLHIAGENATDASSESAAFSDE